MSGRTHGAVYSTLWRNSEKFAGVSPQARLLYLWFLTSEHGKATGAFRFWPQMVPETACARRAVKRYLTELVEVGLLEWDPEAEIVVITQFEKHNPIKSWTHASAAVTQLCALGPNEKLRTLVHNLHSSPGFRALACSKVRTSQQKIADFYRTFEGMFED